jgi:hypothetical protein
MVAKAGGSSLKERENINFEKAVEKQYNVRRTIDGSVVGFENWIQAKMDTLEFALQLPSGGYKHQAHAIQEIIGADRKVSFARIHPRERE